MENSLKPTAQAIIEFLDTTDKDSAKYIRDTMKYYADKEDNDDFIRNMTGILELVKKMQKLRDWKSQVILNELIS